MQNDIYHHGRGHPTRTKTLAMLLFFVSPLASLFRLGILLYDHFFLSHYDESLHELFVSFQQGNGPGEANVTSSLLEFPAFLKMLHNTTTIDEMVQAVLSSSSSLPFHKFVGVSPLSIMFASSTTTNNNPVHQMLTAATSKSAASPYVQMQVMHMDLQAVLPFLFVTFILVWVPLVLFFIPRGWAHTAVYQNYPGQRSRRRGPKRRFEIDQKIQDLLHCLEGCRMVSCMYVLWPKPWLRLDVSLNLMVSIAIIF